MSTVTASTKNKNEIDVENYAELKKTAGLCQVCGKEPALYAVEFRPRFGANRTEARFELCQHCYVAPNDKTLRAVKTGAANSLYAVNEIAKNDLMIYLSELIEHHSYDGTIRALKTLFRRRKLPKRIRTINQQYEEQYAAIRMLMTSDTAGEDRKAAANNHCEAKLEKALFGAAGVVSFWLAVIIGCLFAWMMFAQLVMWMAHYK